MKLKALFAAPIVAWLMVASAGTIVPPVGWSHGSTGPNSKSYQMGLDPLVMWEGKPSITVQGSGAGGAHFGDLHTYVSAGGYLGKRVRFTAYLRTTGTDGWAGAYLTATADGRGNLDPLDMPFATGVKAAGDDWRPVSVVVDVPDNVFNVRMGLMVVGNGQAWLSNMKFEEVTKDMALTTTRAAIDTKEIELGRKKMQDSLAKMSPTMPYNLDLSIR